MKKRIFTLLFGLAAMTTGVQAQVAINATNFPDENFRDWLLDPSNIRGYGADGVLTEIELETTRSISIVKKNVTDLTGIGYFTWLTALSCANNQITSLDLSQNTMLRSLTIYGNPLTSFEATEDLEELLCSQQDLAPLNISRFTKLKHLRIEHIDLQAIDLSCYPELNKLDLVNTNLSALDLSNNPNLKELDCSKNKLTALDFSNNPLINKIRCSQNMIRGAAMDALINSLPEVTGGTLFVYYNEGENGNEMTTEQVAAAKAKGWQPRYTDPRDYQEKDYDGIAPEGIPINVTNFPDENFRNWLLDPSNINGYGADGYLTKAEVAEIKFMEIGYVDTEDLNGIRFISKLETLICSRLSLKKFDDLPALTKLVILGCDGNQLTSLDLSNCRLLEELYCNNNKLTSLDLSNNPNLREIGCYGNCIDETEMGKLVESLPTVSDGNFYVMNLSDGAFEENIISKEQVAAARAKGWTVKALKNGRYEWYEGMATGIAINATNFPDANFRNHLLAQDYGQDGMLTEEEIPVITEIDVTGKKIKDLTGIGYFTALTSLYCGTNQLTTLDVTKNTALKTLRCYENQLTTLDLTKNTALENLMIQYNQIKTIDLSKNVLLKMIFITGNPLTALNTSTLVNLEQILGGKQDLSILQLSNNKKLTTLNFVDAVWPGIDLSQFPVLTELSLSRMNLKTIDVSKNPALEGLFVTDNQLTSLDVSKNPKLKFLQFPKNQLTTIDLSNNPELEQLNCSENKITTLDLSKNPKLWILYCSSNQLTTLDFSNNPKIDRIECAKNRIRGAGLDTMINSLPRLAGWLFFLNEEAANGNAMTSEQLSATLRKGWTTQYFNVANNQWETYYGPATPDVAINATNFPDANFRKYLLAQDYGKDGVLTYDEIINVKEIVVEGLSIADLTGINYFIALNTLYCGNNQLTTLDVSKLQSIWNLRCTNNKLTTLDLSNNPMLYTCYCGYNQLTTLDLSNNLRLDYLEIWRNQISEAEMENLVNSLPQSQYTQYEGSTLYAIDLTYLDEQNVMNTRQVAAAEAKGWTVLARTLSGNTIIDAKYEGSEPTFVPGLAIDATNFPDANFRNYLLAQDYGKDGVLTEEEIENLKSLDVKEMSIADLTGIEHFTALERLICSGNLLTALDVSKNTKLQTLDCDGNTEITSLDLSKNTELTILYCGFLKLTSIDLSKNTKLTLVGVSDNQLTSLDVSMLPELDCILCGNNQLTSLDVSHNPKLVQLTCHNNQLKTLDLSKNPLLTYIQCWRNQIRGIWMEAMVSGLPTVSNGTIQVCRVETADGNEMTKEQVTAAKTKGWQPKYYDIASDAWKDYEGIDTGIDAMDGTNSTDAPWYTLDARKLQVKPAKKGVYIRNGKLVIK